MTNQKHIELFPGSIKDLEAMTGKAYTTMKENSRLVKIEVRGNSKISASENLYKEASKLGADALVHVGYISEAEGVFDRVLIHNECYAAGYAVKEVKPESIYDGSLSTVE